ncbi:MAG: PIG-L family deacetylase [Chloroflexota bacterium]
MTHVFVAPHPDDVALSCGGLIASLRELGQNVTILTLFSGTGGTRRLTPYQREALGFGTKAVWPATEAFNRATSRRTIRGRVGGPLGGQPRGSRRRRRRRTPRPRRSGSARRGIAGRTSTTRPRPASPSWTTAPRKARSDQERLDAAAAGETMAQRRLEDERYAAFAEVSTVFLDLPDAVFRGYEGDDQLLGTPRADDPPPVALLRREIARLEPQRVYFPMGIGGHVDHQLARNAGIELLADQPSWIMPFPSYVGKIVFYEDFPYAHWEDFGRLEDMPADAFAAMPAGVSLQGEFSDVSDVLERKIRAIALYESQMDRLFNGVKPMADAVRTYAARVAEIGAVPGGAAERYWVTTQG